MRTPEDQKMRVMRTGGRITGMILQTLVSSLRPGMTTEGINATAEAMIRQAGGRPSFKMVDTYKWATCITVNEEIVHGVPSKKKLSPGDIVSLDVGVYLEGYHTDAAWSVVVPDEHGQRLDDAKTDQFLAIGKKALSSAITRAEIGNRIGDISAMIQQSIEGEGYAVSREFTGHGIGRKLHERPTIRGVGKAGTGMEIVEGMTLAIEVIYAMGDATPVYTRDDGWTVATKDGSHAALFEHTIAVTKTGPVILTPHSMQC